MKKFSLRLLMLAALVSIACSAYTPKTTHHLAVPAAPRATTAAPASTAHAAQMFYWFLGPLDEFNDYADLGYETAELDMMYTAILDTNPAGGICVAAGYAFPTLPHTMAPQVALYLHL